MQDEKLGASFDGFTIVQVADLHNAEFGENNGLLLSAIIQAEPDIIVFTGDTVDSFNPDTDVVLAFVEETVKIAPCYYVIGNHEQRLEDKYVALEEEIIKRGVNVLRNEAVSITKGNDRIRVVGIDGVSGIGENGLIGNGEDCLVRPERAQNTYRGKPRTASHNDKKRAPDNRSAPREKGKKPNKPQGKKK